MRVVVHIGHPKTGSSAIQSFLALNARLLREFGVHYPWDPSFEWASRGKVSAGNYAALARAKEILDNERQAPVVLFSSERFFGRFFRSDGALAILKEVEEEKHIVCYTRNLFELFQSHYAQCVKRQGETALIDSFINSQFLIFSHLRKIITAIEEEGWQLSLKNYSRHRALLHEDLIRTLLGVKAEEFLSVCDSLDVVVNRSLTEAELELQRNFNSYLKKSSRFVSDPLVNELPNLVAERVPMTSQACERLVALTRDDIEDINSKMDPKERICIDWPQMEAYPKVEGRYEFSREQLSVLAASISAHIGALELSLPEMEALHHVVQKCEECEGVRRDELRVIKKMLQRVESRIDGKT